MQSKKIILAYSGGLDTSVILKWLVNKGYEVIAYIADVGQEDDFVKAKEKALLLGASKVYIEDLKKEFVEDFIFTWLKGNGLYEGKYLLGTSIARPLIAKKQIEIAQKEGTKIVSHGATGKGNDQVRFELTYMALMPDVEIFSPWKDEEFLKAFEGRKDLLDYAEKEGIPVEATNAKPFSMDDNLMHISYEAGILEDPGKEAPADMCKKCVDIKKAPDKETIITINFEKGIPTTVENLSDGKKVEGALELYTYLNEIGAANGVGKIDLVENRFVGMKSRGVYETPAGTILLKAHMDIETITVDKEVMHIKQTLEPKFAQLIYNGFWYSPEMDFVMAAFNKSQENVSGTVTLSLYKGNVSVTKRASPNSLYDVDLASMDVAGGYDQTDAKGFIKLNALRLKVGKKVEKI
ncbi:MAG: argininosuccinate synthase [Candidatus Woesearchaeota archaeon]|jgi:argininosuccinate synthase|nr:argininosuccinate synthase [Candidatus Woesearchaeota archaeon]